VVLAAYETIGAGLCTAIIRGSVANVAVALDVGMVEAERLGELHAVMLVPRPLDDLDQTLPLASCWIEELQPIRLPIAVKETEKELVALPELTQERQAIALPDPATEKERELLSLPDLRQELQPLPRLEPLEASNVESLTATNGDQDPPRPPDSPSSTGNGAKLRRNRKK
jgi:carbon dioxide concentrating mechanism protein CcmO